ncbi:MAG: twin-arginine translocase TatA/TatE family subunit [Bradymonadaceae bacterium]|nr:twin-arginine translocase TatA/TatE family subunit [Lujinxingiaceae bacterium]
MFGLGTTELIIILAIVIMLFGVGKLPIVAKQLGAGIRNFQKSVRGEDDDEPAAADKRIEDKRADALASEASVTETEKSENKVIF